jgi:hypothetical protein
MVTQITTNAPQVPRNTVDIPQAVSSDGKLLAFPRITRTVKLDGTEVDSYQVGVSHIDGSNLHLFNAPGTSNASSVNGNPEHVSRPARHRCSDVGKLMRGSTERTPSPLLHASGSPVCSTLPRGEPCRSRIRGCASHVIADGSTLAPVGNSGPGERRRPLASGGGGGPWRAAAAAPGERRRRPLASGGGAERAMRPWEPLQEPERTTVFVGLWWARPRLGGIPDGVNSSLGPVHRMLPRVLSERWLRHAASHLERPSLSKGRRSSVSTITTRKTLTS